MVIFVLGGLNLSYESYKQFGPFSCVLTGSDPYSVMLVHTAAVRMNDGVKTCEHPRSKHNLQQLDMTKTQTDQISDERVVTSWIKNGVTSISSELLLLLLLTPTVLMSSICERLSTLSLCLLLSSSVVCPHFTPLIVDLESTSSVCCCVVVCVFVWMDFPSFLWSLSPPTCLSAAALTDTFNPTAEMKTVRL